jgi:hypothetical protein
MPMKTFVIAWIVAFVVWMFGSFVVHGVLLAGDYRALPAMFRTEADGAAHMPFLLIAHVIASGALAWIYGRGVQARPWLGQGVRFGLAVACLLPIYMYLVYFAVQPMPPALVVRQVIFDSTVVVLVGVAIAFVHRRA